MSEAPWRRLAPLQLLLSAALLLLLAVALSAWLVARQSWFGLELDGSEAGGWTVTATHPGGPAAAVLSPGDRLLAITADGERVDLTDRTRLNNPHELPRYAGYRDYLAFEDRLYRLQTAAAPRLITADRGPVALTPLPDRPLASLSLQFWLLHLFGLIAALIGLAVWAFQPDKPGARLLAVSGSGFYIATWHHAFWQARELALPQWLFDALLRANHLGLHLMLGALAVLLACYPQRLGRRTPWVIAATFVLILLNENLQLLDWPLHSHYLPLLLYYLLGLALALTQWHLARTSPLDRGALRWVFLSVLLAMGAGMASYFLPLLVGQTPLVDVTTMVGLAVLLYLGFALGVLRYRLFDLERWWFLAWAWFLGGLTVVLADLTIVYFFGFDSFQALGLAVLIVGWVYFPLRQWLWRYLTAATEVHMEEHLPAFVQALYTEADNRLDPIWRDLLQSIYQPLALEPAGSVISRPRLRGNGARLEVPAFDERGSGWTLLHSQSGRRLFSHRDRDIAEALVAIARRIGSVRQASDAGARRERARIQRDLHDDVGGRLLTLVHGASEAREQDLARRALVALREATNALDDKQRYHLIDLVEHWRTDLDERLTLAGVELDWQETGLDDDTPLTSRQYINLLRTLDETVTNALRHAATRHFRVRLSQTGRDIELSIANDGLPADAPAMPTPGRGLNNIQTRLREIDGHFQAAPRRQGDDLWFTIDIHIPLTPSFGGPRLQAGDTRSVD